MILDIQILISTLTLYRYMAAAADPCFMCVIYQVEASFHILYTKICIYVYAQYGQIQFKPLQLH